MIKMIQIEGVEETLKSFDDIQKALDSYQVQAVLKTNGKRIVDSARAMAPHKTGALRKAIGFVTKNDKQYNNVALIGIKHDSKAYQAKKSYPGKYGNILQTDGIQTTRRANKFIQMALEMNQNAVTEGIKKGLENIIKNPKTNQ